MQSSSLRRAALKVCPCTSDEAFPFFFLDFTSGI